MHKVVKTIKIGPVPTGIAVDTAKHNAYVTVDGTYRVVVISGTSKKVTRTINKVGEQSGSTTVDTKHGVLYISQDVSYTVYEVNLATRKIIRTSRFGAADIAVESDAIDSQHDVGYFLANEIYSGAATGSVEELPMQAP